MVSLKQLKITVTEDDIEKGTRCHAFSCPIARALKRMKYEDVTVSNYLLLFKNNTGISDFFILSRRAVKFIKDFDTNKKVKPFTFTAKRI